MGSVFVTVGLSILVLGMPAMPGRIPGDRLIANLSQHLKKDPNDAQLYYLIGRAHYATFSLSVENEWLKKGYVEVFNAETSTPSFFSPYGNIYPWNQKSAVKDTADNRRHISEAMRNLQIAINMSERPTKSTTKVSDLGLAHLTLACTFESGALLATKLKLSAPYSDLKTTQQWRAKAANEYLLAFQKSIKEDSKIKYQPIFGLDTLVAYEAGNSFLRLQPKAKQSKQVKAQIRKLERIPRSGAVTPLILDISETKSLSSLLNPSQKAHFDLDGSGRKQTYNWVQPSTAFLVWDPYNEGKITSGRQLFGNATWWMLWANAYEALNALDDNHDGWLNGKELKGLALWYDRNGNGKSDAGEVISIEKTEIKGLKTSFDGREGDSFVSSSGVQLKNGQLLPTYDWVTTPLESKK